MFLVLLGALMGVTLPFALAGDEPLLSLDEAYVYSAVIGVMLLVGLGHMFWVHNRETQDCPHLG
jgi:hypothetical protein